MKLSVQSFGGVAPRVNPRYLADGGAQVAINVEVLGQSLRPLYGLSSSLLTLVKSGPIKTLYRFGQDIAGETDYWFHWALEVDVCRGQIAGDASEWTFWTGDGYPKATYNALALAGSSHAYPVASRRLGLAAPTTSLLCTGTDPTPTAGVDPPVPETRVYAFTWIATESGLTMESAPSPPSMSVDVRAGGTVALTNWGTAPSDGSVPTGRRVYRAVNGVYLFVQELSGTSSNFTDTVAADALGEAMPSMAWVPPPETLAGLINLPGGGMAGFVGRDVYLCEPFRPYAWPVEYSQAVDYPIVGLGRMDTTLAVLTTGTPYLLQGSDPSSMVLVQSDLEQACVAKRSIVSMMGAVLYASPDGLVMLSSNGSKIVTDALFDRPRWQALNPASIRAWGHDSRYVATFTRTDSTTGGFYIDLASGQFAMHDAVATAGYTDLRNDMLYLVGADNGVRKWMQGAATTGKWRSKVFTMPQITGFMCAQVEAESYPSTGPLTCRFYLDGALLHTQVVTGRAPFRLPSKQGRDWEVELDVPVEVFAVTIAQSMSEIASG